MGIVTICLTPMDCEAIWREGRKFCIEAITIFALEKGQFSGMANKKKTINERAEIKVDVVK